MASETAGTTRRIKWRDPALILILGALALAYVQFSDLESNWRFPYSALSVVATLLLLALWGLFFTGMQWRRRFMFGGAGICLAIAAIVFMRLTLRIEGSLSGAGVPRFVWKWTPKAGAELQALVVAPDAPTKVVFKNSPGDYPQFLGAGRSGILEEVRFGRDWAAKPPRKLWRQPVGLGWSSFAVVGGYAMTQEQRGDREMAVCYEAATGKVIWEHSNAARFSEPMGGDGPRATPTVVDGFVYVLGATGILDCLDGGTGKAVWSRNTLVENQIKNLTWGKSSSPLVYNDCVVVTGGDADGPSLLAYDKKTGAPLWRAGHDKSGYGSPVLGVLAGKEQIMLVNQKSVSGHASDDGHILWEYPWPGDWPKSSQTVQVEGDRIFFSAGYGVGCVLLEIKKNGSGGFVANEVWKNKSLKAPYSNVVVRQGFLYGLDDETLACVDIATGQRRWKQGHYGHGQTLLVDDMLVIQAESGDVALVAADPNGFRELASFPALSSKTWNTPVIAGRNLLVRNDREAACYELPLP